MWKIDRGKTGSWQAYSLKVVPPTNEIHCSFLSQADFQQKTYHYEVQSVYHIEVASNYT